MAKEGTSTIVENKEEKDTIKSYEGFGWELQNAQSLENRNVKLGFTRDKQLPNYSRLVSLEEQYYKIKLHKKIPSSEIASGVFASILWAIICYTVGALAFSLSTPVVGILGIILGSLAIIIPLLFFCKYRNSIRKNKAKIRKREEILNTAKNLLD